MSVPFKVYENEAPEAVTEAIRAKFAGRPEWQDKILRELRYDSVLRCWYFTYAGMFHGVEANGEIHT